MLDIVETEFNAWLIVYVPLLLEKDELSVGWVIQRLRGATVVLGQTGSHIETPLVRVETFG